MCIVCVRYKKQRGEKNIYTPVSLRIAICFKREVKDDFQGDIPYKNDNFILRLTSRWLLAKLGRWSDCKFYLHRLHFLFMNDTKNLHVLVSLYIFYYKNCAKEIQHLVHTMWNEPKPSSAHLFSPSLPRLKNHIHPSPPCMPRLTCCLWFIEQYLDHHWV